MFRPLYNAVVVREDAREHREQKRGILYVPAPDKKEHAHTGTVVSCGRGYMNSDGSLSPLEVKPGDRVIYAAYGGEEHEIEGEKLLIVPMAHVYAVIE